MTPTSPRLHHLDALRSFAMLLGIVLHASLSFMPFPWPVQDSEQNTSFYILFAAIHGFRMPLFFLLSGFFTAMLWRKRGTLFLAKHRAKRVLLPLVIGCFTVIPVTNWSIQFVAQSRTSEPAAVQTPDLEPLNHEDIIQESDPEILSQLTEAAIRRNDKDSLLLLIKQGVDLNYIPEIKITALHWATGLGQLEMATILLDNGADINALDDHKSTALHWAALFGRPKLARLLIERGIDTTLRNRDGSLALDMVTPEARPYVAGIAVMFAGLLNIPFNDKDFYAGAEEIFEMAPSPSYSTPFIFHHLWFLWYLILLVISFCCITPILQAATSLKKMRPLVITPFRYLWMIPLVALLQTQMSPSSFGADTSAVIMPSFPILGYYATFFFFGVVYFLSNDSQKLGRNFWITLPLAFLVILPAALAQFEPGAGDETVMAWLAAAYACLACFGLIGLCRKFLSADKKWVRYISDSSYWLYLTHLPLVLLQQDYVRDWDCSPISKLLVICASTTVLLLGSYQLFVRHTPIGWLLNGRR